MREFISKAEMVYTTIDCLMFLNGGVGVTRYEVARAAKIPVSTVTYHVKKLTEAGKLIAERCPGRGNVDYTIRYHIYKEL